MCDTPWDQLCVSRYLQWFALHDEHCNPFVCVLPFLSCLTLCDTIDYRLPCFSVHGTLQTWKLQWVAMPSSRGSPQPRDWTCVSRVSCIGRCVLTTSDSLEGLNLWRTLCDIFFFKSILWKLYYSVIVHRQTFENFRPSTMKTIIKIHLYIILRMFFPLNG